MARALGHSVSGSDANVYPPMSSQLVGLGIDLQQGYSAKNLQPGPELVIIGNALSRGNEEVEAVLDRNLTYTSGAQWLAENVLQGRHVLAVAGTHGKTTSSSMLAWILESAGRQPGFLIGGIPENFGLSARLGGDRYFVIEADEYDTAFFDKRPKFLHYRPRTAVLNNLEFDHADIYPDLDAIKLQFHYLLRSIPSSGHVLVNADEPNLQQVLDMGCWSQRITFGNNGTWSARADREDGSVFTVLESGNVVAEVDWPLIGEYNMMNALAAITAAGTVGVTAQDAGNALSNFKNVKRRLELRGEVGEISVYDDFAHHPTAIEKTIAALRSRIGDRRLVAVLEPRSNTMRMGVHTDTLGRSLQKADEILLFKPLDLGWDLQVVTRELGDRARTFDTVDGLLEQLLQSLRPHDQVLIMSNGGFENLHVRLLEGLKQRH
ncbi:MAG: UDP-N-acetylmuramate:L-alanyl-gamma-D-glutamyl-meso-diaminopimelate ligase [Gammaproteobacteria bacterium]|nr:MAG: UDP-N-acetylmuramate:L-alanyl-gamma-D-glutamyl-meso-diaminopimelate ligase [Gammaproteobacteria bacterium]